MDTEDLTVDELKVLLFARENELNEMRAREVEILAEHKLYINKCILMKVQETKLKGRLAELEQENRNLTQANKELTEKLEKVPSTAHLDENKENREIVEISHMEEENVDEHIKVRKRKTPFQEIENTKTRNRFTWKQEMSFTMPLEEVCGSTNTERAEEDSRLKQYKNLAKHEDMRRRRTECSVELRKQKRDDMLMKRRQVVDEDSEGEVQTDGETEVTKPAAPARVQMTNEEIIKILSNSPSVDDMRTCFESIRRSLSKNKNPPVDGVIRSGLVVALVQALSIQDVKVRFEAAWALTNVVSGTSEQTLAAVEAGATAPLVALTMASEVALAEQALWAVANIAGDSAQLRDQVIQHGGVEALMHLVGRLDQLEVTFARTLAWAFSNMCRHKNPHAPIPVLSVLSMGLSKLVQHEDRQVRQDSCWAVSYLTDGPDEQIRLAVESGVLPHVRQMLREGDSMIAPALRVLGNMATGSDDLTQVVIDLGTLAMIQPLAERAKSTTIIKECCWLVSNVIAGTQSQIQAAIDAGLIPLIVDILATGDYKCQFEASWAVANLAQGGNSQQIMHLWSDGAVPPLCRLLANKNSDMLANTIETLYTLLHTVSTIASDKLDQVRDCMEENDGLDNLEGLQDHECEKIYSMAFRMINDFFGDDDVEQAAEVNNDENNQPAYNF